MCWSIRIVIRFCQPRNAAIGFGEVKSNDVIEETQVYLWRLNNKHYFTQENRKLSYMKSVALHNFRQGFLSTLHRNAGD